jgi:hypothetical protein
VAYDERQMPKLPVQLRPGHRLDVTQKAPLYSAILDVMADEDVSTVGGCCKLA